MSKATLGFDVFSTTDLRGPLVVLAVAAIISLGLLHFCSSASWGWLACGLVDAAMLVWAVFFYRSEASLHERIASVLLAAMIYAAIGISVRKAGLIEQSNDKRRRART